jgi:hypothetical protein
MYGLFENDQWRVTPGGLEAKSDLPTVYISTAELMRKRTVTDGCLYEWPLHMAENSWVDYAAFSEAFKAALVRHNQDFDEDLLRLSFAEGQSRNRRG